MIYTAIMGGIAGAVIGLFWYGGTFVRGLLVGGILGSLVTLHSCG